MLYVLNCSTYHTNISSIYCTNIIYVMDRFDYYSVNVVQVGVVGMRLKQTGDISSKKAQDLHDSLTELNNNLLKDWRVKLDI